MEGARSPSESSLQKEYGEVTNGFRALTDIRFRLLSFLPLVTGGTFAAIVFNRPIDNIRTVILGVFGLTVTAGVATYNSRNAQLYNELVGRAAAIEPLPTATLTANPKAV